MVIGVTGKYCAGKDTVTRLLVKKGFAEINVDSIGHDVLEEKKGDAVRIFGSAILDTTGAIDRRALGAIVFRDRRKLRRLEALLHPRMTELVVGNIRKAHRDCVINAALLFPMGLEKEAECIIIVKAPFFSRLRRARQRDGLSLWAIVQRFRAGYKNVPKKVPGKVDIYYVSNHGEKSHLLDHVEAIVNTLIKNQGKEGRQ
jgi:dephospho-CoA kinase